VKYFLPFIIFILSCTSNDDSLEDLKLEIDKIKHSIDSISLINSESNDSSNKTFNNQIKEIKNQIESIEIPEYISIDALSDSILKIIGSNKGDETVGLIVKKIENIEKLISKNSLAIAKQSKLLDRISTIESDINSIRRKQYGDDAVVDNEVYLNQIKIEFSSGNSSIDLIKNYNLKNGIYSIDLVTIEDIEVYNEGDLPSLEINSKSSVSETKGIYNGVVKFFKSSQNQERYEKVIVKPLMIDTDYPSIELKDSNFSGTLVLWIAGLK